MTGCMVLRHELGEIAGQSCRHTETCVRLCVREHMFVWLAVVAQEAAVDAWGRRCV